MKRSGMFFASAVAASSAAFTSSDDRHDRVFKPSDDAVSAGNGSASAYQRSKGRDTFAPKFDGLRFIETLVTAHRSRGVDKGTQKKMTKRKDRKRSFRSPVLIGVERGVSVSSSV